MTLETLQGFEGMPRTREFAVHKTVTTILEAFTDRGIEFRNLVEWDKLANYFTDNAKRIQGIGRMFTAVGQTLGPNPKVFNEEITRIGEFCFSELWTTSSHVRDFISVMLVDSAITRGVELTEVERLKEIALEIRSQLNMDRFGFMANEDLRFTRILSLHQVVNKLLTMPEADFAKITG